MREILLWLGVAAALAAAQDVQPDIHYVNGVWERLQQGGVEALPGLQVSSQVRVVLRGAVPGNNRVSFRLVQRTRAGFREAKRRLAGTATIANGPNVTLITAQGMPAYATLELSVPAQVQTANVEILHNGDIEVYGFKGTLVARTPVGDIQADNIGGSVSAYTGGGHIRLGKIGGRLECSTGAGSIVVASAGRDVNCRTAGGEIVVKQAQGPVFLSNGGGNIAVERAAQNVEAHSVQGAIQVGQAGGIVTADTRGGEIRVGAAAGVRAESAEGPVHVTGASGVLSVSAAIGSILAELMAGARLKDSSLMAASGDITVMIPSSLGLRVIATDDRGGVPRIESDFSDVRLRMLNFERPPMADGIINGGGPTLLLSGSGMIYLRRVK